jgi:hypothetical protein
MIRHKRLIRKRQHQALAGTKSAPFPRPEDKPEVRNVFGKQKRWNNQTGKYDLDA